jgi:uncharacterized membrane protein
MKGHRDLRRASAAAVLCALAAVVVPFEPLRVLAAVPLALVLPGYAVVALSFADDRLAPPKAWLLAVAISLMVLAIATVVLNAFPFGLTTLSWAVLLVAIVLGACRGAALRRKRPWQGGAVPRPRLSRAQWAMAAAASVLAVAAVGLAQMPLAAGGADGYTALWMLPEDRSEKAVIVGVLSSEQAPASYRLEIARDRRPPRDYDVELGPGQEETFRFPVPRAPGATARVVASLYRAGRPDHLFRRVVTWIPQRATLPMEP